MSSANRVFSSDKLSANNVQMSDRQRSFSSPWRENELDTGASDSSAWTSSQDDLDEPFKTLSAKLSNSDATSLQANWLRAAGLGDLVMSNSGHDYGPSATKHYIKSLTLNKRQYNTIRKRISQLHDRVAKLQRGASRSSDSFSDSVANSNESTVNSIVPEATSPFHRTTVRPDVRELFNFRAGNDDKANSTMSLSKHVDPRAGHDRDTKSRSRASSSASGVSSDACTCEADLSEVMDKVTMSENRSSSSGVDKKAKMFSQIFAERKQPQRRPRVSGSRPIISTRELSEFGAELSNLNLSPPKLISHSGSSKKYAISTKRHSWFFEPSSEQSKTVYSEAVEVLSLKPLSTVRAKEKVQRPRLDLSDHELFNTVSSSRESLLSDNCSSSNVREDTVTWSSLGLSFSGQMSEFGIPIVAFESGQHTTTLEELSSDQLLCRRLRSLATIELSMLLESQGHEYEKLFLEGQGGARGPNHVARQRPVKTLFGLSLEDMLAMDRKRHGWTGRVPFVLKLLIDHLECYGLEEEGILRMAGARQRVRTLRQELDRLYFSGCGSHEPLFARLLSEFSVPDVACLFKQLVRELSEPLLSPGLEAFIIVPKLSEPLAQVHLLNLLLMTLEPVHREAVIVVLDFLRAIAANCHLNRMTLSNVATVMAPTLFPGPLAQWSPSPKNIKATKATKRLSLNSDHLDKMMAAGGAMERTTDSCSATKMLIHFKDFTFHVPPYLLQQVGVDASFRI